MKKADAYQSIVIDGEEFRWELRHGWAHDTWVGLKGVSMSVWRVPHKTRELIIDLPYSVFGQQKAPKPNVLLPILRREIPAAIEAGWDPDSRGRTFRYEVRENEDREQDSKR